MTIVNTQLDFPDQPFKSNSMLLSSSSDRLSLSILISSKAFLKSSNLNRPIVKLLMSKISGSGQEQMDRKLQTFLLAKIPIRFHPLLLRPPGAVNPAKGTSWDPSLVSQIDDNEDHLPICALPALHLLNSDWDAPHVILQDHEKEEQGIYDYRENAVPFCYVLVASLHAIVHRSEGGSLSQEPEGVADGFWNATQWIPLLSHPFLLEAYPESGGDLAKAKQEAKQFILDCKHAERVGSEREKRIVEERNWREIKGLLKWTIVHGKTT